MSDAVKARKRLEAAPLPGEGASPWERVERGELSRDDGYGLVAESLGHALLVLCEEDPALLEVPAKADDPSGFERAENRKLWDAFKERWPEGDDWLGGATGFQYGWAHNAVRVALGAEPVGNPAIVTIKG